MSDRLHEMIGPVVEGLGYQLWGIEHLSPGRYSRLRVFIDAPDGVDVEDCARVSRQIGSLLDVEGPLGRDYTLEVSSPGLDCRLFRREQFSAFVGADLKVTLKRSFQGRRKFSGKLRSVEGDQVLLDLGEAEYRLPFEAIDRANVVPDFSAMGLSGEAEQ